MQNIYQKTIFLAIRLAVQRFVYANKCLFYHFVSWQLELLVFRAFFRPPVWFLWEWTKKSCLSIQKYQEIYLPWNGKTSLWLKNCIFFLYVWQLMACNAFLLHWKTYLTRPTHPANSQNRNTREMCKIFSKLTVKTLERQNWGCSCIFIVNFELVYTFF